MKVHNAHSTPPSTSDIMYLILEELRALRTEVSELRKDRKTGTISAATKQALYVEPKKRIPKTKEEKKAELKDRILNKKFKM